MSRYELSRRRDKIYQRITGKFPKYRKVRMKIFPGGVTYTKYESTARQHKPKRKK